MNEKLARFCRRLSLNALSLAFILSPIFFLPLTTDFFQFQKQTLFLVLTALGLLGWLTYNLVTRSLRLTLSPLLLPLSVFAAVAITSTVINPNPEVWLDRSVFYPSLLVYFILMTSLLDSSQTVRTILNWFFGVTVLTALWGILSVLGLFTSTNLPNYLAAKNFSPTGSPLTLAVLLLTVLPLGLILAFKTRTGHKKLLFFLGSGVILSSLILTGYQLLPGRDLTPVILPKLASWSIAIDTLKDKVLFGAGPGNFVNQFSQFRPISLNQSPFWQVSFAASGNEYLHLLTTLGVAGLAGFCWLIVSWLKLIKRSPGIRTTGLQLAVNLSSLILLVVGLVLPWTTIHWLIFISLLALAVGLNKTKAETKVKDVIITIAAVSLIPPYQETPQITAKFSANILPLALALPASLLLILTGIKLTKAYLGELYFRQSLVAAEKNLGTATYNLQIKAIGFNPALDRYRVSYSSTNLALANSLAGSPPAGGLSDQDRQTVAQLIQQSIREARTATQINPNKAGNWFNLANIYRNLINFAQGADQFSIASYARAIQLDPANPQLRLELGGLFYTLERYDEAIDRFEEAIGLKPDFANAYYNLAYSYQQKQQWLEAYQAMQIVIALVPADSADYAKAEDELTQLKAKLPKEALAPAATGSGTLTPPAPLPTAPTALPPIEL